MWIRVIKVMRANRFFGPLITTFKLMIRDLMKFMVLYVLIFFIFLCIGVLFYANIPEFSGLYSGSKTMFAMALGQFDLNVFS